MKSRRIILTIEAETDLPLATLRNLEHAMFRGKDGFPSYIWKTSQVQVNAIQPVRKSYKLPKAKRAKGAK